MNDNGIPLPISFGDDDKPKQQHSRAGLSITNRSQQLNFAAPQGMQKGGLSQNSLDFGSHKMDGSLGFGTKYPVQIITLELDDKPKQKQQLQQIKAVEPEQNEEIKVSEPELRYTNDYTSYAVKDQTCAQVLSGLTAVLVNYSKDMDIKIDDQNNTIEGVVFIENYYGIKFTINIWSDNTKTTRFELRRTSGDALATAKFLGDIKSIYLNEMDDKNDSGFNFVSLSLDTTSLDLKELFRELSLPKPEIDEKENEDSISKKELDDVNQSLVKNEMESVDELQFLHEKLCENGAISKDIIDHEQLVKTIIGESLKNADICVVRGCLLILEQLCNDDKISLLLVEQFALFENLSDLLNHPYALIKNYSVRLLYKLASKSNKKSWNMDKKVAGNVSKLLKQYENEWKTSIMAPNGFLNEDMFKSIYQKLNECE